MSSKRFGFSKSARLLKSADFSRVMQKGARVTTRHFVVFAVSLDEPTNRLGITVSRKIGNAIRRNRVKRWVRDVFRHTARDFSAGADVVVLARKTTSFAGCSHAIVLGELHDAWARLGLLVTAQGD